VQTLTSSPRRTTTIVCTNKHYFHCLSLLSVPKIFCLCAHENEFRNDLANSQREKVVWRDQKVPAPAAHAAADARPGGGVIDRSRRRRARTTLFRGLFSQQPPAVAPRRRCSGTLRRTPKALRRLCADCVACPVTSRAVT
jgi:hypothetical protein